MGTLRRFAPDVFWVVLAAVTGSLYGAWSSSVSWRQGAVVGLGWGLVLTLAWAIRRRRDAAAPR